VYGFEEEADALDLAGIISGEAGVYGVGLVLALHRRLQQRERHLFCRCCSPSSPFFNKAKDLLFSLIKKKF
jgi:hypothetical protein